MKHGETIGLYRKHSLIMSDLDSWTSYIESIGGFGMKTCQAAGTIPVSPIHPLDMSLPAVARGMAKGANNFQRWWRPPSDSCMIYITHNITSYHIRSHIIYHIFLIYIYIVMSYHVIELLYDIICKHRLTWSNMISIDIINIIWLHKHD